MAGQLQLDACQDCLEDLNITVWNLMDEGAALLHKDKAVYYGDDGLIQNYQDELRKIGSSQ